MSNIRGEKRIEHGGASFILRPTMQALCAIEGELDLGIFALMRRLGNKDIRLGDVRTVLREMSRAGGAEMPGAALDGYIMAGASAAAVVVVELLTAAFTNDKDSPPGNASSTPTS